jgi:hypothetical protein
MLLMGVAWQALQALATIQGNAGVTRWRFFLFFSSFIEQLRSV